MPSGRLLGYGAEAITPRKIRGVKIKGHCASCGSFDLDPSDVELKPVPAGPPLACYCCPQCCDWIEYGVGYLVALDLIAHGSKVRDVHPESPDRKAGPITVAEVEEFIGELAQSDYPTAHLLRVPPH